MKKLKKPTFDNLDHFKEWVLNEMPILGFVPLQRNPVVGTYTDDQNIPMHYMILFDDGEYRVDLIGAPGEVEFKPHVHPDVDSYEVFLGGDMTFTIDGQPVGKNDNQFEPKVWYNGTHPFRGAYNRFTPETLHSGVGGKRGGIVLSIQRWHKRNNEQFIADNTNVKFLNKD